jgi:hypothetical protein
MHLSAAHRRRIFWLEFKCGQPFSFRPTDSISAFCQIQEKLVTYSGSIRPQIFYREFSGCSEDIWSQIVTENRDMVSASVAMIGLSTVAARA